MKRLLEHVKKVWARIIRNGWWSLFVCTVGPILLGLSTATGGWLFITVVAWIWVIWSYMDAAYCRGENAAWDALEKAIRDTSRQDAE